MAYVVSKANFHSPDSSNLSIRQGLERGWMGKWPCWNEEFVHKTSLMGLTERISIENASSYESHEQAISRSWWNWPFRRPSFFSWNRLGGKDHISEPLANVHGTSLVLFAVYRSGITRAIEQNQLRKGHDPFSGIIAKVLSCWNVGHSCFQASVNRHGRYLQTAIGWIKPYPWALLGVQGIMANSIGSPEQTALPSCYSRIDDNSKERSPFEPNFMGFTSSVFVALGYVCGGICFAFGVTLFFHPLGTCGFVSLHEQECYARAWTCRLHRVYLAWTMDSLFCIWPYAVT